MSRWIFAAFMLSCCAPGPESALNPYTGVERHASGVLRLETASRATFDARAAMVRRDGTERWVLLTSAQRRDGDEPRIIAAWTLDERLEYRMLDRRRRACDLIWSGTCAYEEKGEIRLSRKAFERAAANGGLDVFLSGRRGTYQGHIPPSAFADVVRRATRNRLTRN